MSRLSIEIDNSKACPCAYQECFRICDPHNTSPIALLMVLRSVGVGFLCRREMANLRVCYPKLLSRMTCLARVGTNFENCCVAVGIDDSKLVGKPRIESNIGVLYTFGHILSQGQKRIGVNSRK